MEALASETERMEMSGVEWQSRLICQPRKIIIINRDRSLGTGWVLSFLIKLFGIRE